MTEYNESGNLVTDSREIATSETWASQSDWEEYQEKNDIEIDGDTIKLAEFVLPENDYVSYQFDARTLTGYSDNDAVTSWEDTRVSNETVTGSGTYKTEGINSHPAIELDGSNDGFSNFITTASRPFGLIIVLEVSTLDQTADILGRHTSDERTRAGIRDGNWNIFGGGSGIDGSSDSSIQLLSVWGDSSNTKLREETTQTVNDDDTSDPEDFEVVGIGYQPENDVSHLDGKIAFVEVLNESGVSESDLHNRENEIADYFDINL